MAKKKKVTLTAPETQADATRVEIASAEINFITGEVTMHLQKVTAAGVIVGGETPEYTMPDTPLETIENSLLVEAQTAGAVAAGTLEAI